MATDSDIPPHLGNSDNKSKSDIGRKGDSADGFVPKFGLQARVGIQVSESFKGHVKHAKNFNLLDFIKEEKLTIILTLLGAIGILVLQFVAWKDIQTNGWVTIWSTYFAMVAMIREVADPDICLFGATTVLLVCGIIKPSEAFAGFSNDSIITIALMIGLAAGLEATGVLNVMAKYVLGKGGKIWLGQARMYGAVATISAFMNNTPLVAVMIPLVDRWCKDYKLPVSLFMMPLSYAAILGGLCTIIGTSTNLIVRGLATNDYKDLQFGFFEIGIAGAPVAVVALLYIIFVSPHLLANRKGISEVVRETRREYTFSVVVNKLFSGITKSIEGAGLRNLPGVFVVDIERADGSVVAAPGPDTIILPGDTITFAGDVAQIKNVLQMGGLQAVGTVDLEKNTAAGSSRLLVEAVLSPQNPLVGLSVKEGRFRSRYQASVVAVHRQGEHVGGKIGDIVLRGGDTLLLETGRDFVDSYKHHREFAVVSDGLGALQPAGDPLKQMLALGLFIGMIVINTMDIIELSTTGLALLIVFFLLRIISVQGFRDSIPGMILLTVAGAFGIARAMTVTGVARKLGGNLTTGFNWMGRVGPLFAIYLTTTILTALLSNGASVTIVYPIAKAMVATTGIAPKVFFYVIMLAASSDFSTPIGYQTNLMVQPYGGYRFLDYTKFGVPLQVLCAVGYTAICYFAFA